MLSPKHRRFVAEYLIDLNGAQAAIRAGYSENSARQQASELLTNPDIRAAIEKRNQVRLDKLEITAERVLQEIGLLAFANMSDYIEIHDGEAHVDLSALTREQAAAIAEITVDESAGGGGDGVRERIKRTRFKLADKGLNLERLGRHLKLFTDKVEHSASDSLAAAIAGARKRAGQ